MTIRFRLQLESTRFLHEIRAEADFDTPHQHMCPGCKQWWTCTRRFHTVPRYEPTQCESCAAAVCAALIKHGKNAFR